MHLVGDATILVDTVLKSNTKPDVDVHRFFEVGAVQYKMAQIQRYD